MPKTYRRLTALITHNEEKFPTSELSGIFEGKSITINSALTSDMADLLSQKAAPILVCGSYLFENILLLKVATEAYIKKDAAWAKGAVAIKQMKEKIQKTYATLYKNKPIQKEDPFFTEYQELLSLAPEKYSTESFNELFVWEIPALYPLDDISKDWLLFEYHSGQQPGPAYLLIPYENADARKPMGDALRGILIEHGFNPGVLRAVSIKDLETELINNKGYSFYTNSMSNQDFAQFSSGVSTVFNQIMTDDPNQPWILWMSGHGIVTQNVRENRVAGMYLSDFTQDLLPLLVDKNSRFCYVSSCQIGLTNRDMIRTYFSGIRVAGGLGPKFKGKPVKYPNNLILVLGGISDVLTRSMQLTPIPATSIEKFNKVWAGIDKNDPVSLHFLPFVPAVRYDKFFGALAKQLSAEELPASSKTMLSPWKDVLRYTTPYDVNKGTYIYNNIPQIRFPTYDAAFNVIDVDQHIQTLRYVEVKARELEAQLSGKPLENYPIKIDNKDMVLIYPLSINVPLDITGKCPAMVSARAGSFKMFFKKIVCDVEGDLPNVLDTLFAYELKSDFPLEALPEETLVREVLVEELLLNGISFYNIRMLGSADTITVYYHDQDNKLMGYNYETQWEQMKLSWASLFRRGANELRTNSLPITDPLAIEQRFNESKESILKEEGLPAGVSRETATKQEQFSFDVLKKRIADLHSAFEQKQASLIKESAQTIAYMLASDASLQLLQENNAEMIALLKSIDPSMKLVIYAQMPGVAWEERFEFSSQENQLLSLAYFPDGNRLLISGSKGAKIWDASNGTMIQQITAGKVRATLSFDGTKIVAPYGFFTAQIWDESGKELYKIQHEIESHYFDIEKAVFSSDGMKIAAACSDGIARIWTLNNGVPQFDRALKQGELGDSARAIAFSPNADRVVVGNDVSHVRIWNALNGQLEHDLKAHLGVVYSVAFSRDGRKIVTASSDNTAKIWDADTGTLLHTLTHPNQVYSAEFSADGTQVLTACRDGNARIWNSISGIIVFTLDCGDSDRAAAFSRSGHEIATGTGDGNVKIWTLGVAFNFDQALLAQLLAWAAQHDKKISIRLNTWAGDAWNMAHKELREKYQSAVQK